MRYFPPVRVSVVGVGYMGTLHARKLKSIDSAELVGVWDTDKSRREQVAAELGTKAFNSLEEAIGYAQAVVLATPSDTHGKLGMHIIQLGRHILIEKPIAINEEEASILLELADEYDVVLMTGHIENFNPAFITGKKFVQKPIFVEAHRLTAFRDRGVEVSVVEDLMIHDLELVAQLCGTDVDSVDVVSAPVITDKPDIAQVRLKYSDGCVVNLTASRLSLSPKRKMRIFQKNSYVGMDFGEREVEVARIAENPAEGEVINWGGKKIELLRPQVPDSDPLENELRHFIDCINHNRRPDNSSAVWAVKMCEYIVRHSR